MKSRLRKMRRFLRVVWDIEDARQRYFDLINISTLVKVLIGTKSDVRGVKKKAEFDAKMPQMINRARILWEKKFALCLDGTEDLMFLKRLSKIKDVPSVLEGKLSRKIAFTERAERNRKERESKRSGCLSESL